MGSRRVVGSAGSVSSRRSVRAVVVVAVLTLLASVIPAVEAGAGVAAPAQTVPEDPGELVLGEEIVQPELDATCGEPGLPECEEMSTVSAGVGGYVPVTPERVMGGESGSERLQRRETVDVPVAGASVVPAEGVAAVVMRVTATDATSLSSITVWPAGSDRPSVSNLGIQPGRVQTNLVVVAPGDGGAVSVRNQRGRASVAMDVVGWFSEGSEIRPVEPQKLLHRHARPVVFRADQTEQVTVAGVAGVPMTGVSAVMLHVSSTWATEESAVRVWPAGGTAPEGPSLVAQPWNMRDNIVVVPLGDDGMVSVHNERGFGGLSADVIAWVPEESTYRPELPTVIFDTDPASPVAAGETIDVQVTGVGGVPAVDDDPTNEDAHSVLLQVTASLPEAEAATSRGWWHWFGWGSRPDPTTLTVWPSGDDQPEIVSVATAANHHEVTNLQAVALGEDGQVSIRNVASDVDVSVEVIGWYASPVVATELELPETTKAPEEQLVTAVETEPDGTATVTLDPGAESVDLGDHLVLGVTPDTPEGLLGAVTNVETVDGRQEVTTRPALLEEAIPEGDITVNLGESESTEEVFWPPPVAAAPAVPTPMAQAQAPTGPPPKGLKIDFDFDGEEEEGKDDKGDACSLSGIEASFGPLLDMEFRVKWRWFKAPRVTALATLGAQARVALENVAVQCGWDVRLMKATVSFTAGPVPVVVVFELGAALDIVAGLDGLNIGASAEAWITIGVKDNRGYATSGYNFEETISDLPAQLHHLTAYAMADVWLTLDVKLYGIIGPGIAVGPFLETFLTTDQSKPWWALDFGLAGRISLKLDLWFKKWNWTLWEGEIPLADLLVDVGAIDNCPLDLPHAVLGNYPCRTPKPATRADGNNPGKRQLAARVRLVSSGSAFLPLAIPDQTLPVAERGQPYSAQLQKSGIFSGSASWMQDPDGPALPKWLSLGSDGSLTGTPDEPGVFPIGVKLGNSDEAGESATRILDLTVSGIVTDSLPRAYKDTGYSATLQATGKTPFDWEITRGSLPPGLSLDPATGRISGVPTTPDTQEFDVSWTDGEGNSDTRTYEITVDSTVPLATLSASGLGHSCALGGYGTVSCWGYNASGQLGNGTTTDTSVPVPVTGITSATGLAAGGSHSCAVLADGTVRCWGANPSGQLGNGTTTDSSVPVPVTGITSAVAVTTGGGQPSGRGGHSCALLADGTVSCWGAGGQGELGNGTTTGSSVPVPVTGITSATAVTASEYHSCALLAGGAVSCWGSNYFGQLGNGSGTGSQAGSSVPVAVTGIIDATEVSASGGHSCAVMGDGTVSCWGSNASGELGNGTTTDSNIPVSVTGITDATALATGGGQNVVGHHSCVLRADGTVSCWGYNAGGQLGNGTNEDTSVPVAVTGITDASAVTAGGWHSCAVLADGTESCWGLNFFGQLGNGTTEDSNVPVAVGLGTL